MKRRFFPLALGLCALPAFVLAQSAPKRTAPAPVASAPRAQDDGNILITNSPSGKAIYDDARGLARLTKDVVISQKGENFILRAQEATFDRIKNHARASGKLRVETRDSTLIGNDLFANFDTKMINMTGNVVINAHGPRDGIAPDKRDFRSQLKRKPIRITCNQVDWNYETRQGKAYGNIKIYQEDNIGTCERILYDEGQNFVQLMGNARFGDSKKRVFLGEDIRIYLDNSTQVESDKKIRIIIPREAAGATARPTPARAERIPARSQFPDNNISEPRPIAPIPTATSAAAETTEAENENVESAS